MNTRISAYADRIIEAGWLLAAITAPLFFNVYSSRVFEPDKVTLVRSLALVMLTAWLVKVIDSGLQPPAGASRSGWLRRVVVDTPLVLPALLMVGAILLATLFSVAPRLTFWGSYQRLQGTYTGLSYIVIFLLMLQGLRQREQVERLVTIAILTSIPVTLYGVLQHLQFDPLPWLGDVSRRIASTMGNSIFVAAYLIMVVPLTLGRIVRVITATLGAEDPPTANFVLIPFYVLILVSQLVAIVLTQSRGPWLGLFGGLFFFVLLWLLGLRQRWAVLSWIGLALVGFAFLVILNLPQSPLAPLRDLPYIGRLGRVFSQEETGQVRVLIWRGAADLVTSDPFRFLIGYGPETMHVAYNPFYPPDLAHLESRNASPDRSHNETWDALVTTGALGFTAYMALFTSLFYLGLKWLGLITSTLQRNLFLGLWFGGGLLASLGFVLLTEPGFFGVALPAGMILGLFTYVVWHTLTRQAIAPEARANPYRFLIVALYAAMIAHFVEIHFGIAIASTRTYFWLYCALLVAAGYLWQHRPELGDAALAVGVPATATLAAAPEAAAVAGRGSRRRTGSASARVAPPSRGRRTSLAGASRGRWLPREMVALSLLLGVVLVVMVYDFYAPSAGIAFNRYMAWLFTFSWVFATPIILAERADPPQGTSGWLQALGVHAAVSLGWVIPYVVIHNIAFARPTAESIALAPVPLYIYLGLSMVAIAAVTLKDQPLPATWIIDARAVLYPALAIFFAAIIFTTNVRVVSADILYKQAWVSYHQRRQYDPALKLYNDALSQQPSQDFYLLFKGKALMEKAQSASDAAQREASFREAQKVLEQARALNPLNTDHAANLARMNQTWAGYARSPEERDQRLKSALEYYEEATALSPNNALIWNQWGSAYVELGQVEKGLEIYHKSLTLDSEFHDTYLRLMDAHGALGQMDRVEQAYREAVSLQPRSVEPHLVLGDVYRSQKVWDKAVEAYRRAVQLDPRSASARSALALALAQSGDTAGAVQENLEVLKLAPNDVNTHRNLALLYRDQGRPNDALAMARSALKLAPNDAGLADFVKQLEASGAK